MGPTQTVYMILGIFVLQALIWVPIVVFVRRRSARRLEALRAELAASGEKIERGPESALYSGATDGYSNVKGNGTLILTDRRLIFHKLIGQPFEIPRDRIVSVREDRWFQGAFRGGQMHLILKTTEGNEVGFMVTDHPAWMALFHSVRVAS